MQTATATREMVTRFARISRPRTSVRVAGCLRAPPNGYSGRCTHGKYRRGRDDRRNCGHQRPQRIVVDHEDSDDQGHHSSKRVNTAAEKSAKSDDKRKVETAHSQTDGARGKTGADKDAEAEQWRGSHKQHSDEGETRRW